jgi:hypothetical protein
VDEAFSIFLQEFGEPTDRQEVPDSSLEYYSGKLPDQMLEYWAEHGWCGYGGGIFWIVNPKEYEGVVASWIEGTAFEKRDNYYVLARSAFGDLYLWGENTGPSLKITSMFSRCVVQDLKMKKENMDRGIQNFLVIQDVEYNDFEGMFKRAKKTLGPLKHDEMYGFVPALMLGGSPMLENLEKVKAVEHLIFLSQLAPLEPYSFSDL